jgi:hypothetical protein
MPTIVVSPSDVATHPQGGGHFWVYMQYVQGLRRLGCEVYWLERFESSGDAARDDGRLATFYERMEHFGLTGRTILYSGSKSRPIEYRGVSATQARQVFNQADLLLNFYYNVPDELLAGFRRTALVDIDPGLLQHWISHGQLKVAPHHICFTTGETVGRPGARISDCGLSWVGIRPPVCLELWPFTYDPGCEAFTTVSGWWGEEWVTDHRTFCFENNKRVSFLQFAGLPGLTPQRLELALSMGEGEEDTHNLVDETPRASQAGVLCLTDYRGDPPERALMLRNGWHIRHAYDVAGGPLEYQAYIRQSRGEFSCAKPSCMYFENAWVSDRSLCYLASGKPVVVQHTGPSAYLPQGEGMFRFTTREEAVEAFAKINSDYKRHCLKAREIAETFFDAERILGQILDHALAR